VKSHELFVSQSRLFQGSLKLEPDAFEMSFPSPPLIDQRHSRVGNDELNSMKSLAWRGLKPGLRPISLILGVR
jgi:hypothetical protein